MDLGEKKFKKKLGQVLNFFISHLMRLVTKKHHKRQQGLFLDFKSQPSFERK